VDSPVRTGLVIAELVVLLIRGLYRMSTPLPDSRSTTHGGSADRGTIPIVRSSVRSRAAQFARAGRATDGGPAVDGGRLDDVRVTFVDRVTLHLGATGGR
jgi:hypothetical protein